MTTPRRTNKTIERLLKQKPKVVDPADPKVANKYQSFWVSPEGTVYPVSLGFGHESVRQQIAHHDKVDPLSIDEDRGWIRIRATYNGPEVGWPTRGHSTQKQLDALMDLIGAFLVAGEEETAHFLNKQLHSHHSSTKMARISMPPTVRAKDMPKRNVYNFFISPDGEIFPTKRYRHDSLYNALVLALYDDPKVAYRPRQGLYDKGWISGHWVDTQGGYFANDGGKKKLTQRQMNAVFDIYMAYRKATRDGNNQARHALDTLKREAFEFGLKLAEQKSASIPPIHPVPAEEVVQKYTNYFLAPNGDIYPTEYERHEETSLALRKKFYPKETAAETLLDIEKKGWLSVHYGAHLQLSDEGNNIRASQKMKDTIFDLFMAYVEAYKNAVKAGKPRVADAHYEFIRLYGTRTKRFGVDLHRAFEKFKKQEKIAAALKTVRAKDMPRKEVYDFWMSPDGEIYPTHRAGHAFLQDDLLKKIWGDVAIGYEKGKSLYDLGWISGHWLDSDKASIETGKLQHNDPSQKQLDHLFDIFVAFTKHRKQHDDMQSLFVLHNIKYFAEEHGMKLKVSERGKKEAYYIPKVISPEEAVQKQIEDFFLSPDGKIYPVKSEEHESVSEELRWKFYPKEMEDEKLQYIEQKNWIVAHEFWVFDQGFHIRLTQKQLDTLFDMFVAYKKAYFEADKKDDYQTRHHAYDVITRVFGGKKGHLKEMGLDLSKAIKKFLAERKEQQKAASLQPKQASGPIRVDLDLAPYKNALHEKMEDYIHDRLLERERNQKRDHNPEDLADRIEAVVGVTPDTRLLRQGSLEKGGDLYTALLDAREDTDVDTWSTLFTLMKEFSDYMDSIKEFDPKKTRKDFEENEAHLVRETTKIAKQVEKQLADAAKRVRMSMHDAGYDRINVKPQYMHTEYPMREEEVSIEPITSYFVELGSHRYPPSFTLFTDDHGKIKDLGDVLEGGDTDFFRTGDDSTFYFDLVKEIEHPGSTHRAGKTLTLYTARPTKDRRLYEKGRTVPVNIFLTSDPDRAAGIAHDLGASEVRDIWLVRINEQHLVQTLDTPRAKDYQTVGGNGRVVPVKSIDLIMEGGKKHGSIAKKLSKESWYHGTRRPLKGALKPIYLTAYFGSAAFHAGGKGFVYEFTLNPKAAVYDMSDLDAPISVSSTMDSLGYNKSNIAKIQQAGYDVALDSQDRASGYDQIFVLNPKMLHLKEEHSMEKSASADMPPQGFLEGSVFKDTLYHGTDKRVGTGHSLRPDQGKEFGIYLTPNSRYARQYGRHLVETFVRMKKPLVVEGKYEISPQDLTRRDVAGLQKKGYDGIVVTSSTVDKASEVVAFDPKQVWVLTDAKYGSTE